jgi:CheY-like chemotaxis protein/HPt (histidine-containing phosphotransfer) domain-containing protein/two-component sensor histidine kinase
MTPRAAELRARLAEAERAAESRVRAVGYVAHEFRTPLSSILGFASLLAEDDGTLAPERRREFVDVIHRNARHLLHVVQDILNLAKVEAGTLEVTLHAVAAAEVARAAADSLRPVADARGIHVRVHDHGAPPARADQGRLRQVLLNLLDNAVKYSPPGSEVEVRVRAEGDEVWVEVADRGPGLSEEQQEVAFREFSRIQRAGERVSGAGLGLALARSFADAMGGRIGVRSRPGEGSTFWVALPAAGPGLLPAEPLRRAPAAAAPRTGTVAVVDDDADLRAYAAAVLERAGYTVALDRGTAGAAQRVAAARPLAVLLDLNLEAGSGAALLEAFRAHEALRSTPVLAFSAMAAAEDRERALAAGFHGYVVKPVEPEVLLARVDEAVAEGRRRAAARRSPAPAHEAGEDDEFWAPLRARFRAGLPARLAELEDAVARRDAEAAARHLHKLRGTASGYGFAALSSAAGVAEEVLREGGDPLSPEVAEVIGLLRSETH